MLTIWKSLFRLSYCQNLIPAHAWLRPNKLYFKHSRFNFHKQLLWRETLQCNVILRSNVHIVLKEMRKLFLPGHMTKIWRTAGKSWKDFLSVKPLHVKQQMEIFGQERVVQGEQSGKYQCHKQTKALMSPTAQNAILSNEWMSHATLQGFTDQNQSGSH